jgi:cation diffusion facilitator CzcD-associated flavoprotein CzcO
MSCKPTETPKEVDIAALRAKYLHERDKRLRREGQGQYVPTDEAFSEGYDHDPYTPIAPRAPLKQDINVAVLGGGWSGIQAAYHLKQEGVPDVHVIDQAGDFGGVWYWNRYPGIQCDNDAYCYIPLLEETGFMPSKQFEDGWAIQEHFQRIGRQFGLYEGALFHTLVTSLRWDESIHRWRIGTDRGDDLRARFVVMASGPLNRPKLPAIPGMETFKGRIFHTARWDYDYTGGDRKNPTLDKLADKRVAILGTGATAIQVVPNLGRHAKQTYVIQRTPTSVDERRNAPTDPEWAKALPPGWQKARQANFHRGAIDGLLPGEPDLICDFWTEISRNLQPRFEADGWPQSVAEIFAAREAEDYRVMERIRRRIEAVVQDKATAEALKPWYRTVCKRPCSSNDYLQTFNRPNVKLLDVSASRGLERMTETGVVAGGVEYEIDCMIFASGYEVTSELKRRWGIETIEGRGGRSLYDHWDDGYRTLHGMTSHGFPNQFFVGFYQGGFNATTTVTFGLQGEHIAHVIKAAMDRGATVVEPSEAAQDEWVSTLRASAIDLTSIQRECTPSYLNNEGEAKIRWYLGETYGPGFDAFARLLQDWREAGDLEGLVLGARETAEV